jgi:hypothetical protein
MDDRPGRNAITTMPGNIAYPKISMVDRLRKRNDIPELHRILILCRVDAVRCKPDGDSPDGIRALRPGDHPSGSSAEQRQPYERNLSTNSFALCSQ